MVRAAKNELLESSTHSENDEQSFAPRKFSPVSRRIIEILHITVAASPGEPAGINFDDGNTDDSSFLEQNEGAENGEREIFGEQEVVHVVVKPDVKPLIPSKNTENTVEDSQQSANVAEPSLLALSSQTLSVEDQKMTHKQISKTSSSQVPRSQGSGLSAASAVAMSVASSMSEIREIPRVIATSAGGGGRHRLVVPQHKRMLSSPITHVVKREGVPTTLMNHSARTFEQKLTNARRRSLR